MFCFFNKDDASFPRAPPELQDGDSAYFSITFLYISFP